jgi:hypothetical protein
MTGAARCAFCGESFSRQRPAGEIRLTLPVEQSTVSVTVKICMACVRRMMGESVDRLLRGRTEDVPPMG